MVFLCPGYTSVFKLSSGDWGGLSCASFVFTSSFELGHTSVWALPSGLKPQIICISEANGLFLFLDMYLVSSFLPVIGLF